jgi:hypothetical protein
MARTKQTVRIKDGSRGKQFHAKRPNDNKRFRGKQLVNLEIADIQSNSEKDDDDKATMPVNNNDNMMVDHASILKVNQKETDDDGSLTEHAYDLAMESTALLTNPYHDVGT